MKDTALLPALSLALDRRKVPARLTVTETVYHQPPDSEPIAVSNQYARSLISEEQPYQRNLKVGEKWVPLDLGWLEGQPIGLLILENREGYFTQTIPTEEERQEAESKVIEIACPYDLPTVPCWIILPRESMRAQPADASKLYLRCRREVARCTVTLFPA